MRRVLLNGVQAGAGFVSAGAVLDDLVDGDTIARVLSGGGSLVPATSRLLELAVKARQAKLRGQSEQAVDSLMIAGFSGDATTGQGSILWAPDGGGTVKTFEQMARAVEDAACPFGVQLRGPGGGQFFDLPETFDMRGCWFEQHVVGANDANIVRVADKVRVRNMSRIYGWMGFMGNSSEPVLEWDVIPGNPTFVIAELSATFGNAGSVPLIDVSAGGFLVTVFKDICGYSDQFGTAGMVGLGAGAFSLVGLVNMQMSSISPNIVKGDGTTFLAWLHDGSWSEIALPGFTGTQANSPFGVQGGAGTTAHRPFDVLQSLPPADMCTYGDRTIRKIIAYDAPLARWDDALGAGPV